LLNRPININPGIGGVNDNGTWRMQKVTLTILLLFRFNDAFNILFAIYNTNYGDSIKVGICQVEDNIIVNGELMHLHTFSRFPIN
jgi:hypothetical protein